MNLVDFPEKVFGHNYSLSDEGLIHIVAQKMFGIMVETIELYKKILKILFIYNLSITNSSNSHQNFS
jgi:hypothetical protein